MRILFTKLRHIGDNLLITPVIVATRNRFPEAEIWVAVRRGTEGILAGCPEIDRIVATARPEEGRRTWSDFCGDLGTLSSIALAGFDHAFELGDNNRGRLLVAASRAGVRCTNSYERPDGEPLSAFWKTRFNRLVTKGHGPIHQVLRDYHAVREVFGLPEDPPSLRFACEARTAHPLQGSITQPYAVVHAATRWSSKSWPIERWKEVVAALLGKFSQVVVSCGPNPNEVREAAELSSEHGGRVLSTGGVFSWGQLATLLAKASLFVGVDTAAMHLAAAVQCPAVVLFGHAPAYQFRPWRSPHRVVRARDLMVETERYRLPGEQLMDEIPVTSVIEAIGTLLADPQAVAARRA